MEFEIDSYRHSREFGFIYSESEIINNVFKDYINKGIELVNKKDNELLKKLNELNKYDDFECQSELFINEKNKFENNYLKNTFLKSGVMFLFSHLEHKLVSLYCKSKTLFENTVNSDSTFEKKICKKEDDILSCLRKKIKYTTTFDISLSKQWSNLQTFRSIRNCIAHDDGKVLKNVKKITNFINSEPFLEILPSSKSIILHEKYLLDYSEKIFEFIKYTLNEIWILKNNKEI